MIPPPPSPAIDALAEWIAQSGAELPADLVAALRECEIKAGPERLALAIAAYAAVHADILKLWADQWKHDAGWNEILPYVNAAREAMHLAKLAPFTVGRHLDGAGT